MDIKAFRQHAHEMVDWMADYLAQIERYPVKSRVAPGDILREIPLKPPEEGEEMARIFSDFKEILLPGITHWQHPGFFAYFNANTSYPSILAEMLTATLGAQCMSWVTSPAATELEDRVMTWLRDMIGLPGDFTGVIQDTASTATLCALLTARERRSDFQINRRGFGDGRRLRVYCSVEAHSSIEKAVKIAGFGSENLRKIEVDGEFAMDPRALAAAIETDRTAGHTPLAVVAAVGTTGSTAVDPLRAVAEICAREKAWLHVDAAYAGTALLLPETRWMIEGVEGADSFVFNPHKWMFTNFDCSAYFVRDTESLVRTFEILPEYLKTREGDRVKNYRDWGIQLGRRFRALKLWFVIRHYGVRGLRETVRRHIQWAGKLAAEIDGSADFERLAPTPLGTVCFRYHPAGCDDPEILDRINARLLETVNDTGRIYITHTKLRGVTTLRMVIGQTWLAWPQVQRAWTLLRDTARRDIGAHP